MIGRVIPRNTPGFYLVLSYVAKYFSKAEVLKKIALHCPKDVPDFFAHDL